MKKGSHLRQVKPKDNKVIIRVWTSEFNKRKRGADVGHVSLELRFHGYEDEGCYKDNGEIEATYISFWPEDDNMPMKNAMDRMPERFVNSYANDLFYEKRIPEFTFCFHTLNAHRILEEALSFQERDLKYAVFGKLYFGDSTRGNTKPSAATDITGESKNTTVAESASCVSLVSQLLYVGGIGNLLSFRDKVEASSNVSLQASKGSSTSTGDIANFRRNLAEIYEGSAYFVEAVAYPFIISPDVFVEVVIKAKTNEMKICDMDYKANQQTFVVPESKIVPNSEHTCAPQEFPKAALQKTTEWLP